MKRLLALVTTLVILSCLLRAVDWSNVCRHLAHLDLRWLAVALGLFAVQVVVSSARWQQIAVDYGLRLGESMAHVLASAALNLAIPSKLGDLSKAGFLVQREKRNDVPLSESRLYSGEGDETGGRHAHASVSMAPGGAAPAGTGRFVRRDASHRASLPAAAALVVWEKLLDVLALAVMVFGGLCLAHSFMIAVVGIPVAVLVVVGGYGAWKRRNAVRSARFAFRRSAARDLGRCTRRSELETSPRRSRQANRVWGRFVGLGEKVQGIGLARKPAGYWLRVGLLSLALWTLHLLQVGCFFYAAGVLVTPSQVLLRVPPAIFAGLLPFTVAGIGTRDSALVLLFLDTAAPAAVAVVGMLTALRYLVPGIVGLPVLAVLLARGRRSEAATAAAPHLFSLERSSSNVS